jgi:hypothetical protein
LKRFRATLDEIFERRIERVVLYRSRARGDAREDSDYDILADGGAFIHTMPYPAGSCRRAEPIMNCAQDRAAEIRGAGRVPAERAMADCSLIDTQARTGAKLAGTRRGCSTEGLDPGRERSAPCRLRRKRSYPDEQRVS